jgi:lysophospholipase L1-like esterase
MNQNGEQNEKVINVTPEEIAGALFSEDPKDPNSFQILARPDTNTKDMTYIFEILITIMVEGLEYLAGDLSKFEMNDFSEDYIETLNPWFNSICFNINVDVLNQSNMYKCKKYYCRTIIKNEETVSIFQKNNISKNYHFLLNEKYVELNKSLINLKDLYTIFINGDDIYKISFDFYSDSTKCKNII